MSDTTPENTAAAAERKSGSARSRKLLVPLTTLLVAGAVAVGSGATFTSSTGNTISAVTSGTLSHTNSKDKAAVFNLTNIKPGDTVNGTLTLTNTGSLPADFSLTENASANTFGKDLLRLVVTNTTTNAQVFTGNFGDLVDGEKNALGQIAAGASNTFRFTVTLEANATNAEQGKTASASYAWDSVQLGAQSADQ